MTTTFTLTKPLIKEDIIKECLEAIEFSDEVGQPSHYQITWHYTNHEQHVVGDIATLEEAVDELIEAVHNHGELKEWDEGYLIDGCWEETEALEPLYYYELQEVE